jgi:hypothetical protein
MLRKLLLVALPLVLPFIAYAFYTAFARRRAQTAGEAPEPRWQQAQWTWIALAGVLLMAASLVTFGLSSGVEPGTQVEPPRLVDGDIVPSRPVEE